MGGKRPARARRAPLGACRVRGGVPGAPAGGGWCCGAGSLPADVAAGGRADSAGRAHGRFWGTGRLPASPGRRARHSMWATRSPPAKLYQPSWRCGQETRIKQCTRGRVGNGPARGDAARPGPGCLRGAGALSGPRASQGRQPVLGERTRHAEFLENPPFPEGSMEPGLLGCQYDRGFWSELHPLF